MKEEINLLPTNVSKKRERAIYAKRIRRLVWFLTVPLLLINLSLLAINFSLRDSIELYSRKDLTTAEENNNAILERVRSTNKLVDTFHKETMKYDPWLTLVTDTVDTKPDNTSVVSLSLDEVEEKQALSIRAKSSSRSEVVDWQRKLEELDWVERVEAPLQNLATNADAIFTFTLYKQDKN